MNNQNSDYKPNVKETLSDYGDSFNSDNNEKNKLQKPSSKTTLMLSIVLSVAVVVIVILAVLYFVSMKETAYFKNSVASHTQTITYTEAPTQVATEPPTEKETQKPTKAKEKETKTSTPKAVQNNFNSYKITLYPPTYIYAGPGYDYEYVMTLEEKGVYTIVDECYEPSSYSNWGKLKSGVGWINLTYATHPNSQSPAKPPQTNKFEPYIVTTYPDTDIYAGPGFEYECVMTLDEQGAYTIVEEYFNSDTHSTWGKLKSGVNARSANNGRHTKRT